MCRILKIVATVAAIPLLVNIPAMAQLAPRILLIAREPLKPGAEAEYDRIESETAKLAAQHGCPHPYLALQPLSGAKNEVWWFNGFDSQNELDSVAEAYKKNQGWNIQGGKGGQDRDVMLSPVLLEELRAHWRRLRKKSIWLFPGNRWHSGDHPTDDKTPHHACVEAARRAGIKKRIYPTYSAIASPLTCSKPAPTCTPSRFC